MTDYIIGSNKSILNVKSPSKRLDIPIMEELENHNIAKQEFVDNYFNAILNNELFIFMINGIHTDLNAYHFGPYCNYCTKYCDDMYHYCYDCRKYVCKDCNGSDQDKCIGHEIVSRTKDIPELFTCDICANPIIGNKRFHVMLDNESIDVCQDCSITEAGLKLIDHNKLESVDNIFDFNSFTDIFEFGSVLDWQPILYDNYGNIILYNNNGDSLYAKRFATAHNIDGNYIYHINKKETTIENIYDDLRKIYKENNELRLLKEKLGL